MKSNKGVLYLLLFISFVGMVNSCQNRPKEVLNRKQMERLMYDVYLAEATIDNDYHNFDSPEKKEAFINKVFKAHKTSQQQWDTSLSWYSDRIDIYLKINDSVKARLQRDRLAIDHLVMLQSQSDPIDPSLLPQSYVPSFYAFTMPDTRRGFRFRFDKSDISSKITGDDFQFTFTVVGIPPGFPSALSSLLTLTYSDTTIYRFEQIDENKTYNITASKYIPGDTITGITGYVRLKADFAKIVPNIQLYNISFGDFPDLTSSTDTIMTEPGHSDEEFMKIDTVVKIEQRLLRPLPSDSIK